MRIFTINSGKFAGDHKIFESIEEAKAHGIDNIIMKWWEGEQGDWVKANDGYVLQILHKRKLINPRYKNGQYTIAFRFCNGSFPVYVNSKGYIDPKYTINFYGAVSKRQPNSMSLGGRKNRTGAKERYWLTLVMAGLNPYKAYRKAFPQLKKVVKGDKGYIDYQINSLLEKHQGTLMQGMQSFINEIDRIVKEKTGKDSGQIFAEAIANQIASLAEDDVKIQGKELREAMKFYIQLKFPAKNSKQIPEGEWEEEKPPLLEEGDNNNV
jgi:hypothetical protein